MWGGVDLNWLIRKVVYKDDEIRYVVEVSIVASLRGVFIGRGVHEAM